MALIGWDQSGILDAWQNLCRYKNLRSGSHKCTILKKGSKFSLHALTFFHELIFSMGNPQLQKKHFVLWIKAQISPKHSIIPVQNYGTMSKKVLHNLR